MCSSNMIAFYALILQLVIICWLLSSKFVQFKWNECIF